LLVWRKWFPEGRFVLMCYSDDPLWKGYIEDNVLPKIREYAYALDCSPGAGAAGAGGAGPMKMGAPLPVKLMRAFTGRGVSVPFAVVFKPYFETETIPFADGFAALAEGSDYRLKKAEGRLYGLVDELKDRMSIYI
jgi:hypothetical protein